MVNIDKFKNDGWGLSKKEFEKLHSILDDLTKRKKYPVVVEYGSGRSTEFLLEYNKEYSTNIQIYSFDDSTEFAYKGSDKNLYLKVLPLVETDDKSFAEMFENKAYDETKFKIRTDVPHTRQKNVFYQINPSMIPDGVDLVIVDGPHGNGRSIGFLHCVAKLHHGSIILIDDASHYPFLENLNKLVKTEIIEEQHIRENKWVNGGDYVFCKIVK